MKAKKPERTDRTSMTFPAGVWRAYAAWCRSNGWYPSHRISVFLEKELQRAGIDWRADTSFADVEVGNVKPAFREWAGEPVATIAEATDSPAEAGEVQETEEDEFAEINKMFKL